MNAENDNFSTPKQTKRLGLRRSFSTLKSSATNLMGSSTSRILECDIPTLTTKSQFPQSDIKINYKGLEQNYEESTKVTPTSTGSAHLKSLALSTNCRPYRLALSKKVREKMTKKRLEFYLANESEEMHKEEQKETEHYQNSTTEKIWNTREYMLEKIETAQKELNSRQEHLKKVDELKQAIFIWKTGFSAALHDLQEKIEPRLEIAILLERLHIPEEMIKYIDE